MGYKIRVNGEVVWENDGSHKLITEISVNTPRGEATLVRVPPEEDAMDIFVTERSLENAPHDLVEDIKRAHPISEVLEEEFGPSEAKKAQEAEPEGEVVTFEDAGLNPDGTVAETVPADAEAEGDLDFS